MGKAAGAATASETMALITDTLSSVATSAKVKVAGITDTVTVCECCGRKNLKKTVALEMANGSIKYHGVSCAANTIYGYSDASINNRVRKEALNAQSVAEQRAKDAAQRVQAALAALSLLEAGESLNHPGLLPLLNVWRQTNNVLKGQGIPFKQWLTLRASSPL